MLPQESCHRSTGGHAEKQRSCPVPVPKGGTGGEAVAGRVGAYGLHLPDLAGSGRLGEAPSDWLDWRIRAETATADAAAEEVIDDERALVHHEHAGWAHLDRRRARTDLQLLQSPSPESLVHPLLASTAIIANHWAGRPAFHAGAFVLGGEVWGVLGARDDGKSSTLAWLSQLHHEVLADDVLVLDGDTALAGPRCIDLRAGAAAHLGIGDELATTGGRERWRVGLPAVTPQVPFCGWITLAWAPTTAVRPLAFSDRLPLLLRARALPTLRGQEDRWLQLASKPFVRFSRPRRWDALPAAVDTLLATLLAERSAPPARRTTR
jgi:hypothetical protein